ncbi:hypothetical protein OHT20_34495 [Streptomyces caniferus]|uniref:Uncharacterized protein n=1 Tax=Streptomyces caniferus TaxID=285557 RepID=A0ABZ1VVU1_9ACTN|nr:hypothetical protein [Streptomyces caniferus]
MIAVEDVEHIQDVLGAAHEAEHLGDVPVCGSRSCRRPGAVGRVKA